MLKVANSVISASRITGVLPVANGGTGVTTSTGTGSTVLSAEPIFSSGIGVGGATAGSGGIAFPATAVAVANANTLDDYEEGTWPPTVTNMTTTGSPSYAGVYTKIGNLVLVNFYSTNISGTTYSAVADSTNVTGLPFTTKNTSTAFQPWTGTSGNGTTTAGGTVGAAGNDTTVYFMSTLTATQAISFTLLYLV